MLGVPSADDVIIVQPDSHLNGRLVVLLARIGNALKASLWLGVAG